MSKSDQTQLGPRYRFHLGLSRIGGGASSAFEAGDLHEAADWASVARVLVYRLPLRLVGLGSWKGKVKKRGRLFAGPYRGASTAMPEGRSAASQI
jgi:hypothetical protein